MDRMDDIDELLERIITLPLDAQLDLAARIIERAGNECRRPDDQPRWSDLAGIVAEPFFGEDAQAYISRTRRESDERRGR